MIRWTEKDANNKKFYYDKHIDKLELKIECYHADYHSRAREDKILCKYCFYINNDGFSGQAFTTVNCWICDKEMTFPNTDTDKLCKDCAKEYKMCCHCGAKLD